MSHQAPGAPPVLFFAGAFPKFRNLECGDPARLSAVFVGALLADARDRLSGECEWRVADKRIDHLPLALATSVFAGVGKQRPYKTRLAFLGAQTCCAFERAQQVCTLQQPPFAFSPRQLPIFYPVRLVRLLAFAA